MTARHQSNSRGRRNRKRSRGGAVRGRGFAVTVVERESGLVRPLRRGRRIARARPQQAAEDLVLERREFWRAFDENVVHETTAPVHRNRDVCFFQLIVERGAGELRTLVGIEYAWLTASQQSLLEGLDAEACKIASNNAPLPKLPISPWNADEIVVPTGGRGWTRKSAATNQLFVNGVNVLSSKGSGVSVGRDIALQLPPASAPPRSRQCAQARRELGRGPTGRLSPKCRRRWPGVVTLSYFSHRDHRAERWARSPSANSAQIVRLR